MISLTPNAANALLLYMKSQSVQTALLTLRTAGCIGYQYEWIIKDHLDSNNYRYDLGDGYGVEVRPNDEPLIDGLVIDYVRDGLNHRYIYSNPLARDICGCGESWR